MNHRVMAYAYEGDYHCEDCAYERFGQAIFESDIKIIDKEDNIVCSLYSWDLSDCEFPPCCTDCKVEL